MDESENESENENDSEDEQSVTEEEQLLVAAAAIEERDQKLSSLLEQKNELPVRTRNKFNALVAELLTQTKDDIHEMICDNNIEDAEYRGLDSSRDTEAEVETALRFFPEVISQPCGENEEGGEEYPIQRLCISNEGKYNVKAISFIAVVAPLAIEFHSFEDHARGGLLLTDYAGDNTFRNLLYNLATTRQHLSRPDQNDLIITLLIRLRRMGLFTKCDIRDYRLVSLSCDRGNLLERGFQFLVEWYPTSLVQTNENGWLPLHSVAQARSIQEFQIAFGYGIRYYPFKSGISLLFQKNNDGITPFQYACHKYGRDEMMKAVDEVMNAVDEVLARYAQDTPLNSVEALIVAAVDENIHFDCVYFLFRREPDLVLQLLPLGPSNNNNNGGGGGGNNNGGDDDSDGEENDENNVVDENGNDEDDDNEGGDEGEDAGNHNDEDNDTDDGGDEGKIGDSINNRAGTRKRKRRV